MKRLIDIVVSFILILVISPVGLMISILIIVMMPDGPIFFVQKRIGKDSREIGVIKFRTMKHVELASSGIFQAGNKSRITTFGAFLRKTKLDEIPQLLNVLIGDMSLVGPRPEVKQWTKIYPEKWEIVHTVKPGITDNASIEFRNEEEILANSDDPIKTYRDEILPRKLDMYIDYVNNRSLWGDIKIILKTIKTVILK